MNSIKDIQDEKVRRLAETLRQSGLAASETEAIRMAMSMTNTSDKVSQGFDGKKDQNVMGLSHLKKDSTLAEVAEKPEPVQKEAPQEPEQQPVQQETEEQIDQGLAGNPSNEEPQEEKPKEPVVQTPQRAPPKKDISEMEESKIDLSKVFNSAK